MNTSLILCSLCGMLALLTAAASFTSIPADEPSHVEHLCQIHARQIETKRAAIRLLVALALAGASACGIVAFYP
jgi:hypothetical protein